MDSITATITITKAQFVKVQTELLDEPHTHDEAWWEEAWQEYRREIFYHLSELEWAAV